MIAITVTRKPLGEPTVAGNVLKHGCGALNIDRSRVRTAATDLAEMQGRSGASTKNKVYGGGIGISQTWDPKVEGRWPANLILTGSEEVVGVFPDAGGGFGKRGGGNGGEWNLTDREAKKGQTIRGGGELVGYGDSGSAARFFYCVGAAETEPSV